MTHWGTGGRKNLDGVSDWGPWKRTQEAACLLGNLSPEMTRCGWKTRQQEAFWGLCDATNLVVVFCFVLF